MTDTDLPSLVRPAEFFAGRSSLFKNFAAFRWQLACRRENQLLAYGAVRETALGLMIDPVQFDRWILAEKQRRCRGAAA